jgi:hypothetical protein
MFPRAPLAAAEGLRAPLRFAVALAAGSLGAALAAGVLAAGMSPVIISLSILTLAVPVSLIGLWLTTRAPNRMLPHVAR